MTDRVKGFYVALEKDIRIDDFQSISNAVLMIKGIASVTASIANPEDWMNRQIIKSKLKDNLISALDDLS